MKTFEHTQQSVPFIYIDQQTPTRPPFTQSSSLDRLRECERQNPILNMPNKKPRRSVFREEGLEDLEHSVYCSENTKRKIPAVHEDGARERNITFDGILKDLEHKEGVAHADSPRKSSSWYSKIGKGSRPKITTAASAPPGSFSTLPRAALIVFLIALVVPGFRYTGSGKVSTPGADAGVIMRAELVDNGSAIEGRQNSPTDICTRWAHMSMITFQTPWNEY
jgi:hypothetical protein